MNPSSLVIVLSLTIESIYFSMNRDQMAVQTPTHGTDSPTKNKRSSLTAMMKLCPTP